MLNNYLYDFLSHHFHYKMTTFIVLATNVHNAVLSQGILRHHFRGKVFYIGYTLFRLQGKQRIEKTHHQAGCSPKTRLKVRSAFGFRYLIVFLLSSIL